MSTDIPLAKASDRAELKVTEGRKALSTQLGGTMKSHTQSMDISSYDGAQ